MFNKQSILLVDDDIDICSAVENILKKNGFNVYVLHDSHCIVSFIQEYSIDLILLDIILPGEKNGINICKMLREVTNVPIIMLTGVNEDIDQVLSLEVGADNYIIKPFNSRILLAHIHAALRRSVDVESKLFNTMYQVYEFSGWYLNVTSRILLSPNNNMVKITTFEFLLLQSLIEKPRCVLNRDQLLNAINNTSCAFDRSIDILISRLRSKLNANNNKISLITTIRNEGYSLNCYVNKKLIDHKSWQAMLEDITQQ